MTLKKLEISGFKSFGRKATLFFDSPVVAIVGPNGSGKSNVAEAFRWVLGEQSLKSLRGKRGEDLIFNGSSSLGRLSRASVTVTFDNHDRHFNLDFDEVVISREVFREGTNEYSINGSAVRLKDIIELLASVSLGSSGHHIISQGEADRILNANAIERRGMIEDALGLKIYQWKLQESEKKLAKTEENIKQVESIRREIAPHLKFLKKQVEKIEKINELKKEMSDIYKEYLCREEIYLKHWENRLADDLISPKEKLHEIDERLVELEKTATRDTRQIAEQNELREIESQIRVVRGRYDDLSRKLGRLEGLIEYETKQAKLPKAVSSSVTISLHEVKGWQESLNNYVGELERAFDLSLVKHVVQNLRLFVDSLLVNYEQENIAEEKAEELTLEINKFEAEKIQVLEEITKLEDEERDWQNKAGTLRLAMTHNTEETREAEKALFEWRVKRSELSATIQTLLARKETLTLERENFRQELGEAGVLLGREILDYSGLPIDDKEALIEERHAQEDRRRKIERAKIRLEDMGVESSDVLREHEEVTARDAHLAKELLDLAESKKALLEVMDELRVKINEDFSTGIKKINSEFQKFFNILFGGGSAGLEVVLPRKKKEASTEDLLEEAIVPDTAEDESGGGVEVAVNLPRKKIKGLAMLSGGERALTSIALLFAMSQVNPPPFLILDETDAALDEANSRKYADMIENLSKYSQLILITHNRETMSRAGILYGVTIGADSVSRLISIKFDEAEAYAK